MLNDNTSISGISAGNRMRAGDLFQNHTLPVPLFAAWKSNFSILTAFENQFGEGKPS